MPPEAPVMSAVCGEVVAEEVCEAGVGAGVEPFMGVSNLARRTSRRRLIDRLMEF
jgi:hypothetical protein